MLKMATTGLPALTNVNDIAVPVYHDVPVVPVLQLQEVAHKGVPCHAAHEVGPGLDTSQRMRKRRW